MSLSMHDSVGSPSIEQSVGGMLTSHEDADVVTSSAYQAAFSPSPIPV